MSPLLEVEGLRKYFRTGSGVTKRGDVVHAVDDVSFAVEEG